MLRDNYHSHKGDFRRALYSHDQEKEIFLIHPRQSLLLPCNFRKRNVDFTLLAICVGDISTLPVRRGEEGSKDLPWSLKLYGALEDIKQRESLSLQLQFTCAEEDWFRGMFQ